MTTSAHRFTVQHLIAAAVLAGTATALFLSNLDGLTVRLSPAVRQACGQWWPLLLIVAGGILWLIHAKSHRTEAHNAGATMATGVRTQ
jgi:hypothetical protein